MWWVGLASFVVAGGQQVVVAGLIDSFLQMPVGALAGANDLLGTPVLMRLIELPSLCLHLTLMISAPILVAVITTHLTATICMRSIAVTPGPGVLQVSQRLYAWWTHCRRQQWAGHAGDILRAV